MVNHPCVRILALLLMVTLISSCQESAQETLQSKSTPLADAETPDSPKAPITPTPVITATPVTPTPTPTAAIQCRASNLAFPAKWNVGENCAAEPVVQVHRYDANTYIVRQSLCTNFEAPFLYLLFGKDRVLLLDTGAGGIPIVNIVNDVINAWLAENNRTVIQLVVVNSHAHGDHVAGNAALLNRPNTLVVGTRLTQITQYFAIANWPNEIKGYNLGERLIDIIPIPGHQDVHLALYDHRTGLLLTGDSLYPGRLYIANFNTYKSSIDRLANYAASKQICHVLGTHIEMTSTPKVDFARGTVIHPNEHVLQMSKSHLLELQTALLGMAASPAIEAHNDFIVYPL